MVSPLLIVVVALAAGFLIPLLAQIGPSSKEGGSPLASLLFFAAVAALIVIPATWLLPLASGAADAEVFTAGVRPPLSINLRMGLVEALVLTLVNVAGLFSVVAGLRAIHARGAAGYVLALMVLLGANGLVLTRDLFNAFVFLEILSIGTYGIIAVDDEPKQYAAGFKYLIAGGLSSVLFLLGTVYLYRLTGTLNIDGIVTAVNEGALADAGGGGLLAIGAGFTAPFLLFAGLLIELKPFPANGWALDTYEASNPGVAALVSAVNATAVVMLLYKLVPIFPRPIVSTLVWVGILTFFASNLIGMRQREARRMLGYSSVAQIGLIAAVVALVALDGRSAMYVAIAGGGLLVNHMLAKAGLFWIAGAAGAQAAAPASAATRPTGAAADTAGTAAGRPARGIGPVAGVALILLALALVGLPPFPAFWAKWQVVHTLIATDRIALLVLLLAGTLFEAIYILRWAGRLIARPAHASTAARAAGSDVAPATDPVRVAPAVGAALAIVTVFLAAAGVFTGWVLGLNDRVVWAPFFFSAALLLLEWLPSRVKGVLALAGLGVYAWLAAPLVSGIPLILGGVFAFGAIAAVVASLARRSTPFGTYTLFLLAGTSLTGLVVASEPIAFFLLWELMTVGSYLLIARSSRAAAGEAPSAGRAGLVRRVIRGEGPGAPSAALRYIGFSTAAALLLMAGLIVASHGSLQAAGGAVTGGGSGATGEIALPELLAADGYVELPVLRSADAVRGTAEARPADEAGAGIGAWAASVPAGARLAVFVLLGLAFLVKMGAMGVHVWLPDSYTEADDETTAFLSSSLSKAGLLGVLVLVVLAGTGAAGAAGAAGAGAPLTAILGWIGALTALFGALVAVFQEDVKKLLAYSSLSQVGYMVMGIALATHLGWLAGVYNAVNHFVFKGMLFLAMTGVIMRTGTRYMYEMGGLIKRMPLTFISVLMAIIALSGVPPLSGFGGKWLIYGALLESEWYLQAGVAFFASTIAFLYLFRLIYTVFLGQLKDPLREVREAPISVLIPQVVLMGTLMAISMYPNVIIDPIIAGIEPFFASTVNWNEMTVVTALGYWNGNLVMWVTMVVFILPLAWLMIAMRRPQKVGQFNVVYAAERPERPETTHYAHNFFAPYRKALGFLAAPAVRRAWEYAIDGVGSIADAIRRIYSGNGQTYALHILLLTVALYFIAGGM